MPGEMGWLYLRPLLLYDNALFNRHIQHLVSYILKVYALSNYLFELKSIVLWQKQVMWPLSQLG